MKFTLLIACVQVTLLIACVHVWTYLSMDVCFAKNIGRCREFLCTIFMIEEVFNVTLFTLLIKCRCQIVLNRNLQRWTRYIKAIAYPTRIHLFRNSNKTLRMSVLIRIQNEQWACKVCGCDRWNGFLFCCHMHSEEDECMFATDKYDILLHAVMRLRLP